MIDEQPTAPEGPCERFYFDVSGPGWEPDRVGVLLRDSRAAHIEGVRLAGRIAADDPVLAVEGALRVNVRSEENPLLFSVVVSSVSAAAA